MAWPWSPLSLVGSRWNREGFSANDATPDRGRQRLVISSVSRIRSSGSWFRILARGENQGSTRYRKSTIAINTLLERNGAKTALLITQGFRDIYEIGRVNRPDAYNLFFSKHQPLIPRSLRYEVPERLLADGSVYRELDEARVRELAREIKAQGVESIAILLLHSYRNPVHEIRVR